MLQRPLQFNSVQPQPKRDQVDIIGTKVDNLSHRDAIRRGTDFMTSMKKHHIITANSLLILEAQKNPKLKRALQEASLVISDSSGVSWAAMALTLSRLTRFPGIDLAHGLIKEAEKAQIPIYLLGGEHGIAKKASRALYREFPRLLISGMRDGYFQERDEQAIIDDIGRSHARLVLVALGMPKQEIWINQNLNRLPPALYIGIGGSFDVWAGKTRRAPALVQKSGLEWLYRLGQEPNRWSRISQLPKFALKVVTRQK